MNKILFITAFAILALLPNGTLSAQNGFEAGINYAPRENLALTTDIPNMLYKFGAYGEYRWTLSKHFDFAAHLDLKAGPIGDYDYGTKKYRSEAFTISGDLLAITDFNLFPGKTVNPYIGLGLGPGFGMHNYTIDHLFGGGFLIYTDLRLGFELFQHLRISVDYNLPLREMFTTLNINVGWVF